MLSSGPDAGFTLSITNGTRLCASTYPASCLQQNDADDCNRIYTDAALAALAPTEQRPNVAVIAGVTVGVAVVVLLVLLAIGYARRRRRRRHLLGQQGGKQTKDDSSHHDELKELDTRFKSVTE